jgi:GxxExxY protein
VQVDIDAITGDIVDVSLRIHRKFGPGLFESVYETVLEAKLVALGYRVQRQRQIGFEFEGLVFEKAFFADLVVNETVVVEVKSVEKLSNLHAKQLLTYLRLMEQPVGLLINFGGETLKDNLQRVVNKYASSAPPRLRVNQ